jgi:sec-independent protein translocase protein TatC
MPIFILALVRLRVVSAAALRRNWRLGIFVVVLGAILLPTVDPVSLAFETIPLIALYFLSVGLATVMERRWERSAAEDWATSEY